MTQARTPQDADAAVAWLGTDEVRNWAMLMAVLEMLPSALDTQLKRDAGLNHFEYMILAGLSDAPGHTMGMTQLSLFASGSLSRLSHAVGRLEAKGWVARTPAGAGRSVEVSMTAEGRSMMQRVAPGHVAEARRLVVDPLGPRRLAALGRACRTILDVIDPQVAAVIDETMDRVADLTPR